MVPALSLVPMGALAVYFGEPTRWSRLRDITGGDLCLLLVSCVNAIGISYAGINAQGYVSATTFMVLSNLNKFVVVGFGMAVLREASSWQAVAGVIVALSGGLWYARARAQASAK